MIAGNTLWELLERRVEATPDGPMLLDETGRSLTFSAFKARAESVAAGLQDVEPGGRRQVMPGGDRVSGHRDGGPMSGVVRGCGHGVPPRGSWAHLSPGAAVR